MNITEVRVFPVDEDKLKAFASIVIDDAFVVSDIKIIHGKNGRFLLRCFAATEDRRSLGCLVASNPTTQPPSHPATQLPSHPNPPSGVFEGEVRGTKGIFRT